MTAGKNVSAAGVYAPIGRPERRAMTERLIVEPISLNGTGRTNDEMPTRVGTMRIARSANAPLARYFVGRRRSLVSSTNLLKSLYQRYYNINLGIAEKGNLYCPQTDQSSCGRSEFISPAWWPLWQ